MDESNGVLIQQSSDTGDGGRKYAIIGTRSIILRVDKYFPAGFAPVVQYRSAYLAFNREGELLDINVITATDPI